MGFNVYDFELKNYVLIRRRTGHVIRDRKNMVFVSKSIFSDEQLKKLGILDKNWKSLN